MYFKKLVLCVGYKISALYKSIYFKTNSSRNLLTLKASNNPQITGSKHSLAI